MSLMKRYVAPLLALSIAVCLASALPGCSPSTFKIGVIAELTGNLPAVGKSCVNGARLAARQFNENGGIEVGGKKYEVELVVEDCADKPDTAVKKAEKLIDTENVLAIVGPNASANAVPVAKAAQERGTLMITPWSTDPSTTLDTEGKHSSFVYRACFTDLFEAQGLGNFARAGLRSTRASIIYDSSTPVLANQAELFRKSFEADGGTVVAMQPYQKGATDFTSQLNAVAASSPELLFLPVYYNDVPEVLKQAGAMGISVPFLGSDAWSSPDFISRSGQACEGSFVFGHYSSQAPRERTRSFVEAYKAAYGSEPDDVAALTFDSLGLIREAAAKGGLLERDALREGMSLIGTYEGATGDMRYQRDSGDPIKSGSILQIKDGAYVWYSEYYPKPDRDAVVSFVKEAVDYAKSNGKEKALAEFSDPGGTFKRGELYIYAYDFDGNVIAHGGDQALIGKNLADMKDPNGVMVIQELMKAAKSGGGWVEYTWPNPLHDNRMEKKLGFVMKVDDNWWLGSGLYE